VIKSVKKWIENRKKTDYMVAVMYKNVIFVVDNREKTDNHMKILHYGF